MEPHLLTLAQASRAIAARQLSPSELLSDCLSRLDRKSVV